MSLISVEALQTLIHDTLLQHPFQLRVETVPVACCAGRVLAESIVSGLNMPSADISAMDGYALPRAAVQGENFRVIGESVAGKAFDGVVAEGECVRIMTGAHVPAGCVTVIMQENVQREGDLMTLVQDQAQGQNIRFKAEVIQQGQTVLEAGKTLSVADALLLASVGYAEVPVHRRLRVAVISTGSELQEPGTPIEKDEMIFDSNRPMIMAKLQSMPVEIIDLGAACDDEQLIVERLLEASHRADVVITSGGASVGDYDFVRNAVERIGTIHHYKVAMKPGKPFVFGQLGKAWYFGLPGNPISGFAGFEVFVRPALVRMAGSQATALRFMARLTHPVHKKAGRKEYQRAWIQESTPGHWSVTLKQGQDSHNVLAASQANAFAILPESDVALSEGDELLVQPFGDCFV